MIFQMNFTVNKDKFNDYIYNHNARNHNMEDQERYRLMAKK